MVRNEVAAWCVWAFILPCGLALADECEKATSGVHAFPDVQSMLENVDIPSLDFRDSSVVDIFDRIHKTGNAEMSRLGCQCGFSLMIDVDKISAFRSIRIPQTNILEALRFAADAVESDVKVDTLVWIVSRNKQPMDVRARKIAQGLRTLSFEPCVYQDVCASNVVRDISRKVNEQLEMRYDVVACTLLPLDMGSKKISVEISSVNLIGAFECVSRVIGATVELDGLDVKFKPKCLDEN